MYEYDDYDYVEWLGQGTVYVLSMEEETALPKKRHFWSLRRKVQEEIFEEPKASTFGFGRVLDE